MPGGLRLLLAGACVPAIAGCAALRLHVVDDESLPQAPRLVAEAVHPAPAGAQPKPGPDSDGPLLAGSAHSPSDIHPIGAEAPAPLAPEVLVGIALDPEECRRRAVRRATPSRLITEELCLAQAIADRYWCLDRHPSLVHQQLLRLRKEQRANELAGDAVQILYRLNEAHATSALLDESVREAESAIEDLRSYRERGLQSPAEPEEFRRVRLELVGRRRAIDDSIVQGESQLRHLLGLSPLDGPPIHPVVVPPAIGLAPDAHAAVDEGLARRAELRLIRLVLFELDAGTLPAARGVLQQSDPTLGTATGRNSTLGMLLAMLHPDEPEIETRCRQLRIFLSDSKCSVTAEIVRAVSAVETAIAQLELARETAASREQQLGDVEQRRATGDATPFDITQAKLGLLEARMVLTRDTAALQVAWTRLDQALGRLACGPLTHGDLAVEAPPPPGTSPIAPPPTASDRLMVPPVPPEAPAEPIRPMTLHDRLRGRAPPPQEPKGSGGFARVIRLHAVD